jgi:hypothetical protein
MIESAAAANNKIERAQFVLTVLHTRRDVHVETREAETSNASGRPETLRLVYQVAITATESTRGP